MQNIFVTVLILKEKSVKGKKRELEGIMNIQAMGIPTSQDWCFRLPQFPSLQRISKYLYIFKVSLIWFHLIWYRQNIYFLNSWNEKKQFYALRLPSTWGKDREEKMILAFHWDCRVLLTVNVFGPYSSLINSKLILKAFYGSDWILHIFQN